MRKLQFLEDALKCQELGKTEFIFLIFFCELRARIFQAVRLLALKAPPLLYVTSLVGSFPLSFTQQKHSIFLTSNFALGFEG